MAFGHGDRRNAPRREVRHDAAIVNPWGAPVLSHIVDISAVGARVEAPDAPAVETFFLIDLEMGVAYRVKAVWRSPPQIGTRILETWRLADDETPKWLKVAAEKAARTLGRRSGRKTWFKPAA